MIFAGATYNKVIYPMSYTALLPRYFPNIDYFAYVLPCKTILIADHLQYVKRSSITRTKLDQSSNYLSIPVVHDANKKAIFQKKIATNENWKRKHLTTIRHLYTGTVYFDELYPQIHELFLEPVENLSLFLLNLTSFFLKKLKINVSIKQTSLLQFKNALEIELIHFGQEHKLKKYYYDLNDVNFGLLNISLFNNTQIQTCSVPKIKSKSFEQMNILELLFNHGPEAAFMLRDSF